MIGWSGFTHEVWTDGVLLAKRRALVRSPGNKTVSTLLALLDARQLPGVTDGEFRMLFAKCGCGLITTHRAFKEHRCFHENIDLADI